MKAAIKKIPILGDVARRIHARLRGKRDAGQEFRSSSRYWEQRYEEGGNSGAGSYGKFAAFKAEILNAFVQEQGIQAVIEYGCGDGNQLKLAQYPRYLGFDVSETAIRQCRELFQADATKSFKRVDEYDQERADLTLSLDVIYHLVEDPIFESYMQRLFHSSDRYVILYASNTEDNTNNHDPHVKHRAFTQWVQAHLPEWKLLRHIPNKYPYQGDYTEGSFADFYIYQRV